MFILPVLESEKCGLLSIYRWHARARDLLLERIESADADNLNKSAAPEPLHYTFAKEVTLRQIREIATIYRHCGGDALPPYDDETPLAVE